MTLTQSTESAFYFNIFEWTSGSNGPDDNSETIAMMTSAKDFKFIGITKISEIVTEADEENDIEEERRDVLYAVFTESSTVYKIEIAEFEDDETLNVSGYSERIKISTTTNAANDGLIVPEIIGDYLFIMSTDSDKKTYMYKMDLTITENSTKEASKVALEEK